MNGVGVILQLLLADAPLKALVPAVRIQAGILPVGTALPALSVTLVSSTDRNIPSPSSTRYVTDRVQVTVLAADYPSQIAVLQAARKAAADKRPTAAGLTNVTVHTDGRGPDFTDDDASICIGSQDFRVRYNEGR